MIFLDHRDWTAEELIRHMNETYRGMEWPMRIGVNAATFGRICSYVFRNKVINGTEVTYESEDFLSVTIALGKMDSGIMLKNVEIVLV